MRLSTLLAPLAATSTLAMPAPDATTADATIQKRACFTSGETWGGDRSNAENKAISLCNAIKDYSFSAGRNYHRCYNLSSRKKVDFTIKNHSDSARKLTYGECMTGIGREISGCGQGGARDYLYWRVTADPNAGQCA
ncbi:hypothetical protein B0T18DRAFT_490895 [Schizothecium vesticola]|uniref:Glycan binding protein Y3-like domain-containing protein n=1 Tax=Schizothecium vesticola TaxID=314040 RepID=A0AA40EIW4_9PEZI|nr:hypothetical protein B0T18DRAFT_490895 [Schizothecium vesticola]